MFDTGPNILTQALASPTMTALMTAISAMGTEGFFVFVLTVVMFVGDFRRGYLLLQISLWSGILNHVLKAACGLPRPVHVDSGVLDHGLPNHHTIIQGHPPGFFALPADVVTDAVRQAVGANVDEFGFPSGHVQSTVVLWGSGSILWRRRWMLGAALVATSLMAVSRMYLGRHFLGDVLGGLLIGLVVCGVLAWLLPRRDWFDATTRNQARSAWSRWVAPAVHVMAPLALIPLDPARGGALLGFGAAYLAAGVSERVDDSPRGLVRIVRVLLALLSYLVFRGVTSWVILAAGVPRHMPVTTVLQFGVPAFLMLWVPLVTTRRAGARHRSSG